MVVSIELPGAWSPSPEWYALSVTVAACRLHGRELDRRQQAMAEARAEFATLLQVIDGAVVTETALRRRLEAAADPDLVEAFVGRGDELCELSAEILRLVAENRRLCAELELGRWRERAAWRWGEPAPHVHAELADAGQPTTERRN
jgi:hypothetical protein